MLLGEMLRQAGQRRPGHVALWFGERRWTFADLDDSAERIAAALAGVGVCAGDRVGLFLLNCPELVLSYFACFKLGAITVPLNYRYRQDEARYALEHSGASALIVHPTLVGEVAGLPLERMGVARCYLTAGAELGPPFAPFDQLLKGDSKALPAAAFGETQPAAILYTSGTTARPKGVTYTHGTLWANCESILATFGYTADDIHLVSTAACHAAAFTGQLLPNVLAGGTAVLTHLPTPDQVVRAIETRRVTRMQMLPATLEDLVEFLESHPGRDLKSLRVCNAGGDVVPHDLHERFRKTVGFDITELCGMTEALSYVTNPPFGPKKMGSIGKPSVGYQMRLVNDAVQDMADGTVGEILVKGPAVTTGYWNDPKATAAALRDGWLFTGDLGKRDADGDYWFVGRKKEIIIRGGSNISPLEVEEVIDEHPAVRLSCVVGVPDPHYGEIVAAYVAIREDAAVRPTVDELRQFVAGRIAAYKVPERITIMDDLPLNSTGKVDRKKLHALVKSGG